MAAPIYLETSRSWSYAVALEWPGWARHAKGDVDPIEALIDCGPRYGEALAKGDVEFDLPTDFEVVAVVEGDSGTEWGVPSIITEHDREPLTDGEAERQVAILEATWAAFDRAARAAEGHELRKGPRGGGRDLPRLLDHCLQADKVDLSKLGSRRPRVDSEDWFEVETAMRDTAIAAFFARQRGEPVAAPSRTRALWPLRWYVRYVSWHALVHAWELEDRRLD